MWSAPQAFSGGPASFDLGSASEPEAVVFVCDLPADPERANQQFDQADASLQASLASLGTAQERLEHLVRSQAGGVSFDAQSYPPGSPESQALALLGEAGPGGDWESTSFGVGEAGSEQWNKVTSAFQEFMGQLDQVVGHLAWVNTQVSGSQVVRSTVGWTGNLETAWQIYPTPELAALHRRTLRLTLASRAAMLRTFGVVSSGAVKLAALVASPAGAILALPAAWQFIRQVQAESARYSSIKEQIGHGE